MNMIYIQAQVMNLIFSIINRKKKFDGKKDVLLEQMSDEKLDEFLAKCKKKVYIEAGGPYGNYGRACFVS